MGPYLYSDFREFLRRYITQLPKKGRGEITRIAAALRVSTTLVSQVLAGDRCLTPEQGHLLADYLGYTGLDADYLAFLLQLDRAGSVKARRFWQGKLDEIRVRALKLSSRVETDRALTDAEQAVFYSDPIFSAIRLFASVGTKGKGLEEILERFDLKRARAIEMLRFLVATGLCRQEKERYFLGVQKTHLSGDSPHVLRHHCNWRLRAIRQSESLEQDELMYTVPVSLSHNDFGKLREEMVVFIKNFLAKVHASPAEEVACFNLDFFRVRK